jgi:hypothetical protein
VASVVCFQEVMERIRTARATDAGCGNSDCLLHSIGWRDVRGVVNEDRGRLPPVLLLRTEILDTLHLGTAIQVS